MNNFTEFWLYYATLQAFWFGGAIAAWFGGMLTVTQMQKSGHQEGMPYLYHFGVWNDFIVIHLWAAAMLAIYAQAWLDYLGPWLILVYTILICLSTWANEAWVSGPDIQAHGHHGKLSLVGNLHILQMAIILFAIVMAAASILLGEVPWELATGSFCLVLAHICMGDHWPLRLFSVRWTKPWPYNRLAPFLGVSYAVLMAAALFFLLFPMYLYE